jgi:enoyl-CoA hydratase/carnithine racemase
MTTIHPEGGIDLEVRSGVLLIGINRPNKRNGFTPKMYRELGEAYTRLDDDPSLRVGVLHAMGEHFTAGLDLPTIAPLMQRGEKVGFGRSFEFGHGRLSSPYQAHGGGGARHHLHTGH